MAGASGFVLKQIPANDLVHAVRTVASGQSLLDARTTSALLNKIRRERGQGDPVRTLSEQERAVLELIGDGLTNREIAERMSLAEKTVKNYESRNAACRSWSTAARWSAGHDDSSPARGSPCHSADASS